jgi:hypothetical protein
VIDVFMREARARTLRQGGPAGAFPSSVGGRASGATPAAGVPAVVTRPTIVGANGEGGPPYT